MFMPRLDACSWCRIQGRNDPQLSIPFHPMATKTDLSFLQLKVFHWIDAVRVGDWSLVESLEQEINAAASDAGWKDSKGKTYISCLLEFIATVRKGDS